MEYNKPNEEMYCPNCGKVTSHRHIFLYLKPAYWQCLICGNKKD